MPTYYIMDLDQTMAETVAPEMPSAPAPWLTEDELAVYSAEYARTGFQGGLQWYRCRTERRNGDLDAFAGRTIDVPSAFIAGASDWGIYQVPGRDRGDAAERLHPHARLPPGRRRRALGAAGKA